MRVIILRKELAEFEHQRTYVLLVAVVSFDIDRLADRGANAEPSAQSSLLHRTSTDAPVHRRDKVK